MKRYLKIFLVSAGSLLLIFLIAFGIGKWYISTHKEEIIAKIKKGAKEKYYSVVAIKDIELTFFSTFPHIAIHLSGIDVQGPMYHIHHQKLFSAKTVDLSIRPEKLILGKIVLGKTTLKEGNLYIYTDSNGVSNLSYFKSEKQKAVADKKPISLPENIQLQNFDLSIIDLQKEKKFQFYIHKLSAQTNKQEIKIVKDITVRSLAFNAPRGSFIANTRLTGNYSINFNPSTSKLTFEKITIAINKHPFVFSGNFQLDTVAHFSLHIGTKQIPYELAKSLLLPHISKALADVQITTPIDVDTELDGPLNGGDPLVIAKWKLKTASVSTTLLSVDSATLSGLYTNEVVRGLPRKDPNSKIAISNLTGKWNGIPISAKLITVNDLSKPKVMGEFESNFNLSAFNTVLQSESFGFSGGTGKLNIQYTGPLDSISKKNASIDIGLQLVKGTIAIHPLNLLVTECQTDIAIRDADIYIKKLSAKASDGSNISITGSATNTFALIDENLGKVVTSINIYSPFLNLSNISKMLRGHKKPSHTKSKQKLGKTIGRIDQILEKEIIQITLRADKIKHNNLIATNFSTNAKLYRGQWSVDNLSLQMAGGGINVSASVTEAAGNKYLLKSAYSVKGVDASALFYAFDNFGLKSITDKNITGKIEAVGKVETLTDKFGNIDKKKLTGDLRFSLKNGSLKKIKALEEIGDKYLKKRNLSDLRFAEISNKLTISQGVVSVPRMQIEATAFRLFIEGQYGIAGATDLRIQVPLSNLTAQDAGYVPKKTKQNAKGGMSIYLRAKSDENEKIGISLDMLGAIRKSNLTKKD
ncbi:MAG: hypothetical protein RL596_2525 [Bacteroidota bacterium]